MCTPNNPNFPHCTWIGGWYILYDTSQKCRLLYAFDSFVHFLTVYRNVCFKKLLFFFISYSPSLENAMFAKLINKKIMILNKKQNVFSIFGFKKKEKRKLCFYYKLDEEKTFPFETLSKGVHAFLDWFFHYFFFFFCLYFLWKYSYLYCLFEVIEPHHPLPCSFRVPLWLSG